MKWRAHQGRVHMVGIKGVAMTSMACWLRQAGYEVTGSDTDAQFPTEETLAALDVPIFPIGSSGTIEDVKPDVLIYTGAHGGQTNAEVHAAQTLGIPVYAHGKALGEIMQGYKQICVAGSHGKTTTSAMIATVFVSAGMDPSYAIGCGSVRGLGFPGHAGNGEYFIAESDEYVTDPSGDKTPRFLWQRPEILVITNFDYDHPDVYENESVLADAFHSLVLNISGTGMLVVNADDEKSEPFSSPRMYSFGRRQSADMRIRGVVTGESGTTVELVEKGASPVTIHLRTHGMHNAYNAASACLVARLAGISWDAIAEGIGKFGGAKRRFEHVGTRSGHHVYDDYAHHPTEIRATLAAARSRFGEFVRIICVFQPHTYTRTKALLAEFGSAFEEADTVIITPIYASAREAKTSTVTVESLVDVIKKNHTDVTFVDTMTALGSYVDRYADGKSVVIMMGAGDINVWAQELVRSV